MKNFTLSIFFLFFSLGLAAQTATEDLRIFPNPVSTTFEIGHSDRIAKINVINMMGREIKAFDYADKETYNIAELPQGMYLVQLKDKEDKVIHTQRIKKN
ncbi:T9SS type A sorting domain-containing protein [Neolewinella persica]|uniref:T9SS type A sorting domain-containing protein n=1 Tax=Neolewinella persica TaxID=70998 RepID=UPI000378E93E|nr:T9SS type A sorting domain-containing protein [Neolewinella persica]